MNLLACTHDKRDGRRQKGQITNIGELWHDSKGIVQGFWIVTHTWNDRMTLCETGLMLSVDF